MGAYGFLKGGSGLSGTAPKEAVRNLLLIIVGVATMCAFLYFK